MQHQEIAHYIKRAFGFEPTQIKRLTGYDNVNYLIGHHTEKYVFKTYTWDEELFEILKAENEILTHLSEKGTCNFPIPIPLVGGEYLQKTTLNGDQAICRMLSFLEGAFLGDVKASPEIYTSLGTSIAQMNLKLKTATNYVLRSREQVWDLAYFHLNKKFIHYISDAHDRAIVRYFFQQYEENVLPVAPELRKQIIHGDANEWNILTENNQVSGLIDFGDICHSYLINEVAITLTYICYDKEAPLAWVSDFLKAYHTALPLTEKELSILYYLIAARLCTSVCNSAYASNSNPSNTYATVSEKHAWSMLYKWLKINPLHAERIFRKATGYPELKVKSNSEALKARYTHLSSILSVSYKMPIQMERSAFQYMYDVHGNTFLDAYNNIPHVGQSHPNVVAAGQRQMAKLNTNTRYLFDALPAYAEKLLSYFPNSLNRVFFVNSGSAASDLAMRMAHAHTGHKKIMVTEHGYHGNTQIGIDISDYKFNNKKGQGQKEYILKTQIPDTYNGPYRDKDAGKRYAQDAIKQLHNSQDPVAAFVSEPIVGCGGQVPLAPGYLEEVYPSIRKQGGICISDEVQTGFGRLGDYFWGYEAQNVIPDMVILGKPIANGHPMGAVVTTQEIADSFGKGVEFFSSFGGNPVSCEIAHAVLNVIEEEQLQKNAKEVGDFYKSLFISLKAKYTCIGDVRGSGLFLGVEIIHPENGKTNNKLAQHIKNSLREMHILISTDGPDDSVLKTKPPLCFTKANAKQVVDSVDSILAMLAY